MDRFESAKQIKSCFNMSPELTNRGILAIIPDMATFLDSNRLSKLICRQLNQHTQVDKVSTAKTPRTRHGEEGDKWRRTIMRHNRSIQYSRHARETLSISSSPQQSPRKTSTFTCLPIKQHLQAILVCLLELVISFSVVPEE